MSLQTQSLDELREQTFLLLISKLGIHGQNANQSIVVRSISETIAAATYLQLKHIEHCASQITPMSASGEVLDMWASVYGMQRKPDSKMRLLVQLEAEKKQRKEKYLLSGKLHSCNDTILLTDFLKL